MLRTRDEKDGRMLGAGDSGHEQLEADRKRVTAPIDTSATSGSPSPEGIAIASGFVRVSGAPPEGGGSRRGEVAVSSATSPPAARRRTQ